ncbi:MAG: MCE family protein [Polyangiaceae bacterium]|nr:MCE family protein [Polyangiaceae bacterium]
MIKAANHFKLGLFVILAIIATIATAAGLGAAQLKHETVAYYTYFNESVQGLEVGAPVKFRGVTIGIVSAIEIGPDRRHVEVVADLFVQDIRRMGLTEGPHASDSSERVRFNVPAELRAQLGSQGITGVKYLNIDYFDPVQNPAESLPFQTPENYIPAATSLFKNLEDTVVKALDQVPEMSDAILNVVTKIDAMLDELQQQEVPHNFAVAIGNANLALQDLRKILKNTDDQKLPAKASKALDNLDVAVTKLNRVLGRMDGDDGLVASATRATNSLGNLGKTANGTVRGADETLQSLGEAAEAIKDLAETLERDPDMLLKGRAKEKRR